jgi:hypothetical protein
MRCLFFNAKHKEGGDDKAKKREKGEGIKESGCC